jgi:general L-amino acid transport system substrate-binding protein
MKHLLRKLSLISSVLLASTALANADTIKTIRDRGHLICGSSPGVAGFSKPDANGRWEGFDTDICRALAMVIFNDQDKIRFVPLSSKDRLIALQSGEVDVLPRTTTWTLVRNAAQGVNFTAVNYYDGQGFMVRKSLRIQSSKELAGATICVAQGTTSELNLADYFRAHNMKYEIVNFVNAEEGFHAYANGRCDAYTTDLSALAAQKLSLAKPDEHMLLPDVISKEPLGPWVRQGDERWFNLVRWTVFAMINAEELGITKANVEEMRQSKNPEVARFLGVDSNTGEPLGVTQDWVVRIIKTVGNYGESFERHLGRGSRLALPRGVNNLWTKGGLQYSPPFR